jgi:hypothetical protein
MRYRQEHGFVGPQALWGSDHAGEGIVSGPGFIGGVSLLDLGIGWPIWVLDKPFSLVGDAVTLPCVLWKHGGAVSGTSEPSAEPSRSLPPTSWPSRTRRYTRPARRNELAGPDHPVGIALDQRPHVGHEQVGAAESAALQL